MKFKENIKCDTAERDLSLYIYYLISPYKFRQILCSLADCELSCIAMGGWYSLLYGEAPDYNDCVWSR